MSEEQILHALRQVIDPEIGVNVVDLGLVYSVNIEDDRVHVALTMTTRACPLGAHIREMAESAIRQTAPEANRIEVELVWDPPWDPNMMSAVAKQQLGWG